MASHKKNLEKFQNEVAEGKFDTLKSAIVELIAAADKDWEAEKKKLDAVANKDESTLKRREIVLRRGTFVVISNEEADANFEESKTIAGGQMDDDDDDFDDEEGEDFMDEMEEEDEEEDEDHNDGAADNQTFTDPKTIWEKNDEILREIAIVAICTNRIDALKFLVESGAVISGCSRFSMGTVLHEAAGKGTFETLEYLLSLRIDDKKKKNRNQFDNVNVGELFDRTCTPLHWAALHGQEEACKRILCGKNVFKDLRNKDQFTAVHLAVSRLFPKIVKILVGGGCDPNIINEDGHTALHLALGDVNDDDTAAYLIRSGKCDLTKRDIVGWTPIVLAVTENKPALVRMLLEAGSPLQYGMEDADSEDEEDLDEGSADLPLISLAAKSGNLEIVSILLELRKEEVENQIKNEKDRLGKTPLDWAKEAKSNKKAIIAKLSGVCGKREREE